MLEYSYSHLPGNTDIYATIKNFILTWTHRFTC